MVVYLKQTADTGSNKPGKYSVQLTAQAYSYKRPNGFSVSVYKPVLDRLSFTYDVPDDALRSELALKFKKEAQSGKHGLKAWTLRKGWGASKYSKSYAFDIGAAGQVLVQHTTVNSDMRFLRFELGGSALEPANIESFKNMVPALLAGLVPYEQLATESKVTRIDIAVDLINIDLEDILISAKKPGVTMGYFGLNGKAETKYLNVNKKGSNLYVYDRKSLLQKLQDEGKGDGSEYQGTKYTRVEVRLNPDRPLSDLANMKHNPFKKINLIDIESPSPPEAEHHWALFQDACRYRGVSGALDLLPPAHRPKYEAAIDNVVGDLWNAQLLWDLWPITIEKSGLLP